MVNKRKVNGKVDREICRTLKVKRIISTNAVELELPGTARIHLVVNISRIRRYKDQVQGQKKQLVLPVIIEGEKEYEVEKIMNKKKDIANGNIW